MQHENANVSDMGLMDEDQARAFIGGVCKKTMYNLRTQDGLPWFKVRGRIMYDKADLRAWCESRKVANVSVRAVA